MWQLSQRFYLFFTGTVLQNREHWYKLPGVDECFWAAYIISCLAAMDLEAERTKQRAERKFARRPPATVSAAGAALGRGSTPPLPLNAAVMAPADGGEASTA